jgi:hypothetical protein
LGDPKNNKSSIKRRCTNVGVAVFGDPENNKINNVGAGLVSAHAITLITLVITIILLLILAGVAINLSLGDNGLFTTAKKAKEEYLNAQTSEEEGLNDLYSEMLVATGDDSKITISVEDLNKLIDQRIQNTFCNPKLLTTIALPSSGSSSRAAGTYYANSTSFTKTNTTDFDSYLSFDANTGWTVLKSGYYMINSYGTGWAQDGTNGEDIDCVMCIGDSIIDLGADSIRSSDYQRCRDNTTIFIEKGTVINFFYSNSRSSYYSSSDFIIYALFQ